MSRRVLVALAFLLVAALGPPSAFPSVAAITASGGDPVAAMDNLAEPPASISPFFPNIPITDGTSPYTDQVEPTMAVNRSGAVFVGWKETNGAEAAGIRVGFSYSLDRGAVWAPNILMNQSHPNGGCFNSDPWMALAPDDRVQYAYLEYDCTNGQNGLDLSNTTNGRDWSNVHYMLGGGGLTDKESIVVDGLGRVYAAWDEGNVLMVSWTDDGGTTWAPFRFPDDGVGGVLGAVIQTSPSGVVYLTWWDFGSDDILFDWSADRGQTWHTDVRVNDVPGSARQGGPWALPMPAMNVDPASGAIYVIWTDSRGGGMDIYMSRSTNGGATWSSNTRANDVTTNDQRMPDLAIDGTGKVHAAWYDDRTGNHNIYYANSSDGGQTWSANVRVTTEESPGSLTRPGDYFAIEAAPDNTVHVVWTDGRGSDYDIYYARNPGFPAATLSVSTNPAGLKVQIDNVTMTSPAQKTVLIGSTHTVGAPDPQAVGDTTRYVWASWSDGGDRIHAIVADADVSLTAAFRKQFRATSAITPSGPSILVDNVSYGGPATFWWDQGTSHWLEAPSPQATSSDTRFVWVVWSDSGARAHAVIATAPLDVTATFQQEHTLVVETIPTNLTFTLDGTPAASPETFWLALGSAHTVGVDTLQDGVPGVRYRFLQWSDGGAATHAITMNAGMVLTARFRSEFYLTVVSPTPGAAGAGWYLEGSVAYATVSSPTEDVGPGERLVFQGWGGDASGSGTTSGPILMDGPKTAIAIYGTQYYLSVQTPYGTAAGSGWYPAGTSVSASVSGPDVSVGPGAREHFVAWSGDASGSATTSDPILMDGPKAALATWQLQYYLTIQTAYGTALSQGWYDADAVAFARLDANVISLGAGARAAFLGWFGDASGTDAAASSPIPMNGPKTVLASWQAEYELRLTSAYGQITGAGWYLAGSSALLRVSASPVTIAPGAQAVFLGWGGDATGTGLLSNPIPMDGPKAASASWTLQYYLTVDTAYASATTEGWYDAGTMASARLTASQVNLGTGARAVFLAWSGDASGTDAGGSSPITMDRARTAAASWRVEYELRIVSAYGSTTGAGWYPSGSSATATINATVIPTAVGTRVVLVSWGGDTGGTGASSNALVMDAPKTATASWQKQYLVLVDAGVGTVEGGGWYAAGSSVTLRAPSQSTAGGQTYAFAGWTGSVVSSSPTVTFTLDGPKTFHATWAPAGVIGGMGVVTVALLAVLLGSVVAAAVVLLWRRRRKKDA